MKLLLSPTANTTDKTSMIITAATITTATSTSTTSTAEATTAMAAPIARSTSSLLLLPPLFTAITDVK